MRASATLKFLDRWIGIPLVFALGCFFKRRAIIEWPAAPRIGLLHTAAIGDTILLSAVIADLKKRWPNSQIVFFVSQSNEQAALLIPEIEVVKIPVISVLKAIRTLQAQRFDLWIDFGAWARINAVYSFFAQAQYKLGFKTTGQYRHFVYDQHVLHQEIHELDNARNLLAVIGVETGTLPRLIPIAEKIERKIVFHLYAGGSRAELKHWPENRWIELMDALTKQEVCVVLTGSEKDRSKIERVKKGCQRPAWIHNVAGELSLAQTAKVLVSSMAVVSVDTGIMHLAAALGCFTVALHGPTSPQRWGGVGPQVVSLKSSDKKPCIHLGFENRCVNCDCMRAISVEQVLTVLKGLI